MNSLLLSSQRMMKIISPSVNVYMYTLNGVIRVLPTDIL